MQNAIFFDIDGTIVAEGDFLPASAVNAIHSARQNGVLTIINTGRTAKNVDPLIREIGFDGYIYGCGTEMEYAGETLFHISQTAACSRAMVELVRSCAVAVLYERSDAMFYDPRTRMMPGLQSLLDVYAAKHTAVFPLPLDENWQMDKFVIWHDSESDLARFQAGIANRFDYIDRGNGFAEMVPCGCSKAKAMAQLLQKLRIPKAQTYAIGDSLNDRSMLALAGTGIAMGDPSLLHPYADYITAPLRADGLAKALEHFHLI